MDDQHHLLRAGALRPGEWVLRACHLCPFSGLGRRRGHRVGLVCLGGSAGGEAGGSLGGGGGEAIEIVGTASTATPSAVEAAAAVPRVEASEACTVTAAEEAGTAMLAVMITLAAATLIVTSEASTPAAVAMFCRKDEVSA